MKKLMKSKISLQIRVFDNVFDESNITHQTLTNFIKKLEKKNSFCGVK